MCYISLCNYDGGDMKTWNDFIILLLKKYIRRTFAEECIQFEEVS